MLRHMADGAAMISNHIVVILTIAMIIVIGAVAHRHSLRLDHSQVMVVR